MARATNTVATRRRRKKIIKQAKGYFVSKGTLYRTANEQIMRSHAYAYRDRKRRKREFRKLWIQRINAAARINNLSYSKFMHGLTLAGVEVNRKMLADLAVNEPAHFAEYAKVANKAIDKANK